jgi:hypothetical protein
MRVSGGGGGDSFDTCQWPTFVEDVFQLENFRLTSGHAEQSFSVELCRRRSYQPLIALKYIYIYIY